MPFPYPQKTRSHLRGCDNQQHGNRGHGNAISLPRKLIAQSDVTIAQLIIVGNGTAVREFREWVRNQ